MAAFPAYAKIIFEGYSENEQPAVSRTDMEDGPPKQFQKKSRVMIERPVTIFLNSAADKASFRTWYRVDIQRGTGWFDWVDPADGATKQARFKAAAMDYRPRRKVMDRWVVAAIIETWDT